MLCTFYLWMLSKMTLHPQTLLSERKKKQTEAILMLRGGQKLVMHPEGMPQVAALLQSIGFIQILLTS